MEKVCQWLDIPWNDTALKSTVNGYQWWNEKNTPNVSGSSKVIVDQRFEEFIPWLDRFRLNVLMAPKFDPWGYEVNPWHRGFWARFLVLALIFVPFKMELITFASLPRHRFHLAGLRAVARSIYPGRIVLLRAWLRRFRGRYGAVKLL